jgi:predicted nucleic acid-binding protein
VTSDAVADSCVVAKWLLIEPDTAEANRFFADVKSRGGRIVVLALALIEVAQAIWKRVHRGLLTADEGKRLTDALLVLPVTIEPSGPGSAAPPKSPAFTTDPFMTHCSSRWPKTWGSRA